MWLILKLRRGRSFQNLRRMCKKPSKGQTTKKKKKNINLLFQGTIRKDMSFNRFSWSDFFIDPVSLYYLVLFASNSTYFGRRLGCQSHPKRECSVIYTSGGYLVFLILDSLAFSYHQDFTQRRSLRRTRERVVTAFHSCLCGLT